MAEVEGGIGIDMIEAAEALPRKYRVLKNKILGYRDAFSAHTDLVTAFDMIVVMEGLMPAAGKQEVWAERAVLALMNSAIVLYARATISASRHRSTLNLAHRFSPEESEVHELIKDLRNDAVAHFGPGGRYAGPAWSEESVFLPLDQVDGAKLILMTRRVVYDVELIKRIKRQVHRSMILAERVVRERDTQVVDEFETRMFEGPEIAELLKRHKKTMAEYYGTERAAIIAEGRESGARTLTFRDR